MTLRFYTYIHRRATDGAVFYVGKGSGGRSHSTQRRNKHWHNIVAKHGVAIEIVAYFFTEEAAFDHEIQMIAEYRRLSQPLCNLTDGGDGISGLVFTEEHRANLSAARVKRTTSAETRAKMSASMMGKKHTPETVEKVRKANIGKVVSAETCAKISASKKGTVTSAETKEKLSRAGIGRIVSAETRAKIGAKHKGKIVTEEARAKLSKAHLGKTPSAETRAKLSLKQKEFRARKRLELSDKVE